MKSMQPPAAAIFFMTNFYRGEGGMAPSPPGSATALGYEFICILLLDVISTPIICFVFFIFIDRIRSMGEGNVFTPVCHSVYMGGGGGLPSGGCVLRGLLSEGESAWRRILLECILVLKIFSRI